MTAKEFLREYEYKDRIAKRLRAEYEKEVELIDAIRVPSDIDGMPHGTGVSRSAEEKAIRLADKASAWRKAELDAIEARQKVFDEICSVKDVEGDILYERYINQRQWEEICVIVHLSWTQTHERHKNALRIIQQRLQKTE